MNLHPTSQPTQAVILAGGRGTRLRPLTDTRPKAMIEIVGKPFLEYIVEQLREQGFQHVLLLLGYLPNVIRNYFGDGSRWGLRIDYSVTPEEDETGTRIRAAAHQLDACFLLLYCDNYWPMRFPKMWERFTNLKADAMVTVYTNRDGYTTDGVSVGADGFVTTYDKTRSAPNLQGVEIGYTVMRKSVLGMLPEENVNFEAAVYPQLALAGRLAANVTEHRYYSIGSHARLPATEAFLARRPAVILDRDGVLNVKPPRAQYVKSWREFQWLPGAKEALRNFAEAGYRIIVVSNQAGIGRGAMTEADLADIHQNMSNEACAAGGRIDAVYYCPHDWDAGCECRKPKPGMLYQAQKDHALDLTRLCFVGDDERDVQAAEAAGCSSLLVSETQSLLDISQKLVSGQAVGCQA